MSKYPEIITPEVLAKNAAISDEELERDINVTVREIVSEQRKLEAYNTLAAEGDRMAYIRESATKTGIQEREDFVLFLQKLQHARKTS